MFQLLNRLADIFAKGLHKKQFDFLIGKLAMEDIFKPARGGVLESQIFGWVIAEILEDFLVVFSVNIGLVNPCNLENIKVTAVAVISFIVLCYV